MWYLSACHINTLSNECHINFPVCVTNLTTNISFREISKPRNSKKTEKKTETADNQKISKFDTLKEQAKLMPFAQNQVTF